MSLLGGDTCPGHPSANPLPHCSVLQMCVPNAGPRHLRCLDIGHRCVFRLNLCFVPTYSSIVKVPALCCVFHITWRILPGLSEHTAHSPKRKIALIQLSKF